MNIPHSASRTCWLNHAFPSIPKESLWANTVFENWVPYPIPRTEISFIASHPRPFIAWRALACLFIFIPLLAIDAEQTDCSIEILPSRTDAFSAIPNLASNASCVGASLPIPKLPLWADTLIGSIQHSSALTERDLLADTSCPIHMIGALATISIHIPDLPIIAVWQSGTGEPIPLERVLALAAFWFRIKDLPSGTWDTFLSIPVQRWRAFTNLSVRVQELAFRAWNLTSSSIPISPLSTRQAYIFRSQEGFRRTHIHTFPLIRDRIPRAILALGSYKEDILESQILG